MPDLMMLVDTAVIVPVNILPLLDDTDFKSREVAVAYDAAGMDLVWNFVTAAGVCTQTAVTPTTAGNYDWTHLGDGMYTIEIPASGGVSINNDTEGFGWFTGIATGVLPWRGPIIQFSPANVVNALVPGSDYLQTHAVEITDGLITAAAIATNAIDADAIADGAITAATFAAGAIDAAAIATGAIDADAIAADAITAAKVAADVSAEIADAVWDEARAGHVGAGSFGEGVGSVQGNITGSVASVTGAVGSVTGAVGSVTGNVGGNVAGSVASVTGAVGSVTGSVGSVAGAVGSVTGAVGSVTAGVTVTTNNDKTGYALSAAGIQAIWDALTSALTAVGSIGKLLVDNVNATIGSRLATAGYTTPPTVGAIADQVWDEAIAGHLGAGSTGTALNGASAPSAAAVADAVWDEARGDHTAAGSFGQGAASVQGNVTGSVASVTGAVGSVTGSVGSVTGAVGSVTGAVGSVTGAVGSVGAGGITAASFGAGAVDAAALAADAANKVADALLDRANAIETGWTPRKTLRVIAAALAGKLSGAATTTVTIRNLTDDADRIVATVDANGNRTAITLTGGS